MAEHSTAHSAAGDTLHRPLDCVIVTPEATILEQQAEFMALPLYDGEIGIAPGHTPMIGRLGYGELRIVSHGTTHRYYVDGGFVQVAGNVVSVLTNRAMPASQLDPAVAAERLAAATARRPHTEEGFAERDALLAQARAQLRMAERK